MFHIFFDSFHNSYVLRNDENKTLALFYDDEAKTEFSTWLNENNKENKSLREEIDALEDETIKLEDKNTDLTIEIDDLKDQLYEQRNINNDLITLLNQKEEDNG